MTHLAPALTGLPCFDTDQLCGMIAERGWAVMRLQDTGMLAALREQVRSLSESEALTPAGIGRADDHELTTRIRRDKTRWLDPGQETDRLYLDFAEDLRLSVNARLMLGLFAFEAHYAVYEPGAFYKQHVDSFRGARNRVLSTVLYLNPDWSREDGGLLRIFDPESGVTEAEVLPEFGTLAAFLSEEIPHEVALSHRERFSIAGWHRCNDLGRAPALQARTLPIAPS